MSSDKKIALVTGASRGIGAAIAEALAQQGFKVIGTATTDNGAQQIEERLKAKGYDAVGRRLNVTEVTDVEQFFENIVTEFGAPLVLVNNAGITQDNLLLRLKESDWDAVLQTNLTSVFRLAKLAVKGMTKVRWGRIINISSVIASMGNAG